MGSICLDDLTHADSRKGIAYTPAELSGRLYLVNTHADLHRSRSGSQAIGVFCFKEHSECEKGKSRPMKDRLCCQGTTPYCPRAFESAAGGDRLSPLAGPGHIEGKGDQAGMKSPGKFLPLIPAKGWPDSQRMGESPPS
jgi:hypothetical protein